MSEIVKWIIHVEDDRDVPEQIFESYIEAYNTYTSLKKEGKDARITKDTKYLLNE